MQHPTIARVVFRRKRWRFQVHPERKVILIGVARQEPTEYSVKEVAIRAIGIRPQPEKA